MQDATTENVVAIISALGGGAILATLIQALIRWLGGRAGRERNAVDYERKLRREAEARADTAERQLDHEASARRKQAEYSSQLRRKMIEHGIPVEEIPLWPMDASTIPREEVNRIIKKQDPKFRARETS